VEAPGLSPRLPRAKSGSAKNRRKQFTIAYTRLVILPNPQGHLQVVENRAFVYSIETVEVAFFETLHILGIKMPTNGSTGSNIRSFEVFLSIYLSIITPNI
jgi:hypothetical protein